MIRSTCAATVAICSLLGSFNPLLACLACHDARGAWRIDCV